MPIVTIQMFKGRSVEAKRDLVKNVTEAVCKSVDLKPETVTVLIEEHEPENWAGGGTLFSDK
jgi:4-oxalocrotonate tautomerase